PDGAWEPTRFAVVGLGKLGGQELNYSSDVDVLFIYTDEGHVFKEPPRKQADTEHALSNHQFFKRLAEAFIAEVTRTTPDGTLYRIDLRLRPEGDAGPLVRSLGSYENFYAQWGQTWERMMLIKARGVAGDTALAAEFLEMIQPYRYPRSLGEGALREIAAMKSRIEKEIVKSGEKDRNVKLGRGGIREIEFVAQAAQLLHAG
ncbi:MAG: glutamate-ammonia-ligase adenylyltransferase, partial [Verrucomicrobia bacterium]